MTMETITKPHNASYAQHLACLNTREYAVVHAMSAGKTGAQIAALLGVSGTMVNNYRSRIRAKLSMTKSEFRKWVKAA